MDRDEFQLELARVKVGGYTRTTKTGKTVRVKSHSRSLARMLVSELLNMLDGSDRNDAKRAARELASRERTGKLKPPHPETELTPAENRALTWAGKAKALVDLKDGKGPVETWLRDKLKKIGLNPYALDLDKLDKHAAKHAEAKGVERNAAGESRFWFKSPCWTLRDVDFAVHQCLPVMVAGRRPDLAQKLIDTSPRWKDVALDDLLERANPEVAASRLLVLARRLSGLS